MTTMTGREVHAFYAGDPDHTVVIEIDGEDEAKWYAARETETRLGEFQYGRPVAVTDRKTGLEYVLRSAPCGSRCRCAADVVPLEEAGRLFVGERCTLDGVQATISGTTLKFGWVSQWPRGLRVEYAWPTIARIMANGGEFKS